MRLGLIFAVFAGAVAQASYAWALSERVALVIGNGAYEHVSDLSNPANDASDIAEKLETLGFEVTLGLDLDFRSMRLMLRDFGAVAETADVAIVYFAGHGIEIDKTNYLIPVNAELRSDRDVEFEALELDSVVGAIAYGDGLKIVLVDACRNNPFVANMTSSSATRSIGRGLGGVDPGAAVVGYAARSGTLALDGDGRNSPYAQALLEHLGEPGLELGKVFRKVRDTVSRLTDGYQQPFTYGSLPAEDIFLVPAALPEEPSAPDPVNPKVPENDNRPKWCQAPKTETEVIICQDTKLLELETEVSKLMERRLAVVRGGSPRGQALVEQREWRISRDECRTDRTCIARSYQLRVIALAEFSGEIPARSLIVRSIQEELNRLSCGAGAPDGVLGPQTTRAYELATSLDPGLLPNAPLDTVETLATLRLIDRSVCSSIERASLEPRLMEGVWRISVPTCKGPQEGRQYVRVKLKHDFGAVYSGVLAFGNNAYNRAVGAQIYETHCE